MVRDQSLRIVNRKEVEVASILVSDKEDFFRGGWQTFRVFGVGRKELGGKSRGEERREGERRRETRREGWGRMAVGRY